MRRSTMMVGVGLLALGCGAGGAADQVRPKDATYHDAVGGPSVNVAPTECREIGGAADPLVIDWKPEDRSDIEVAMKEGIAVVQFDCKTIRLLRDCNPLGRYAFIPVTQKVQVIRLVNADEIHANLPLGGPTLTASLGGGASREARLDVALSMIGKTSTTKRDLTRGDLLGRCEGATHFVRRALLGAFALRTGSNAEVVTAAELFGAGAGASSKSDKIVANRDGDLNACKSSSLTASEPPNGCGALLRLELLPIGESPDIKSDKEEPGIGCPEGLVRRDGKCASPVASTPAPTCTNALDQFDTCILECDQRMSPSCDHLLHDHLVLSSDQQKKYAQILGTMCERGADEACVKLAQRYRDANGVAEDRARADALAMGACGNGNAEGCWLLMQLRKSDVESRKMSARACYAGSAQACGQLGSIYAMDNKGNEAGPFFERACDGGLDDYCLEGAKLFETGNNGTTRDAKRSAALYWGVCKGKSSQLGCHKVAEVAGADFARPLMETHCRARATADSVCYRLASFYDVGEYGFSQDRARAAELFETICMDKGDTMTCAKAADALVSARGDKSKPRAIELLRKGCKDPNTSKDWSCNRLKQMGENP